MRYTLIVEDTPKGISVSYVQSSNGVQDHPGSSLAAHTTASFALSLSRMAELHALAIEQHTLTPTKEVRL